jgi:hypothetical protein
MEDPVTVEERKECKERTPQHNVVELYPNGETGLIPSGPQRSGNTTIKDEKGAMHLKKQLMQSSNKKPSRRMMRRIQLTCGNKGCSTLLHPHERAKRADFVPHGWCCGQEYWRTGRSWFRHSLTNWRDTRHPDVHATGPTSKELVRQMPPKRICLMEKNEDKTKKTRGELDEEDKRRASTFSGEITRQYMWNTASRLIRCGGKEE